MRTGFGTDPVPVESAPRPLVDVGAPAPAFSLPDADMEYFELAREIGRHIVVLYFFPRDGTPTSIRQAIDFSDHDGEFAEAGAIVVGVSPDDVLTHASFRDEHGLSIRLLSDPEIEVCRLYGAVQSRDGQQGLLVRRASFVIGLDGIVRHALHETRLRGHAAEVLDLVRKL